MNDQGLDDRGVRTGSKLERRVTAAARSVLDARRHVAPVEVLTALGWLPSTLVDDWRRGRVEYLERVVAVGPERVADALEVLHRWVRAAGLHPTEVEYLAATRDRRVLRFTADGGEAVERAYRTHWLSPQLTDAARDRLVQRQSAPPDLVVVSPLRDWECAECGEPGGGALMMLDGDRALCLTCVDLDHLVFLAAGDAALTRRARKASGLSAVVLRFNRSRKRYDRLGLLVEPAALETAELQCLGDEQARLRRRERDRERRAGQDEALVARMAREILRLFPGCPVPRSEAIAAHACVRGSGRVGRSAAGRALADDALIRAVVASVRHEDTDYDELLMSGVPRAEARERIGPAIDRVLDRWRSGRRVDAFG